MGINSRHFLLFRKKKNLTVNKCNNLHVGRFQRDKECRLSGQTGDLSPLTFFSNKSYRLKEMDRLVFIDTQQSGLFCTLYECTVKLETHLPHRESGKQI